MNAPIMARSITYLRPTSIIHKHIRARLDVAHHALQAERQNALRHRFGSSQPSLQAPEIAHQARDQGRRHAGAALDARPVVAAVVGALDVEARSPDVDFRPVVAAADTRGGVDAGARLVRVADGESLGEARGRRVADEGVFVAGGDDGEDAVVVEGFDGGVEGGGGGAGAKGHAEDGGFEVAFELHVFEGPVEAGKDRGHGCGAGVEDLDVDEGGLLCDAVGFAGEGAGDVGTVAGAVVVSVGGAGGGVCEGVDAEADAALELGVGGADAGVDDIGGRSGTGAGVVEVGIRRGALDTVLVRKIGQAPNAILLGC